MNYQSCSRVGNSPACEYRYDGETYSCGSDCSTCSAAASALLADACPTATCTGVATSCSLRSVGTCSSGQGCSVSSDCEGFASSCYTRYSSYSCNAQDGCYWSTANGGNCSGSAWSCSLMNNSSSCIGQAGCNWASECGGTATACSQLSTGSCALQPGCTLTYQ